MAVMRQVQIKTGKVEIILVDIAKPTQGDFLGKYVDWSEISNGTWTELGKATELTEQDWKGVVDAIDYSDLSFGFEHYMSDEEFASQDMVEALSTATESGLSLLKSNGVVLENSILSTYPVTFDRETKKDWQEAESKVWRNCHVFIKQLNK